ncbi:MAG TPA: DUF6273 domain-containing protein [Candidatus Limiplasma sp.]|nr:DUF6273 domain-containing protein [Candidatus Limiplasma sp.]
MMKKMIAMVLCAALCLSLAFGAAAQGTNEYTVGSIVTYGTYEQDNDPDNGQEPIEWIVLDVDGTNAFLISKYCLDAHAFHTAKVAMTWEKCELRTWLNTTFMDTAFTAQEQAKILQTEVVNDNNPDYGTFGGKDTVDQIYLLSFDELYKYFPEQDSRSAYPTAYAIANGAFVNPDSGYTYWWLRTPGVRRVDVCGVSANGVLSGYGSRDVNRTSGTVRPVMWVDFSVSVY